MKKERKKKSLAAKYWEHLRSFPQNFVQTGLCLFCLALATNQPLRRNIQKKKKEKKKKTKKRTPSK